MNKISIIIIAVIILTAAIFFLWYSSAAKTPTTPTTVTSMPAGLVLFYSQGCPHCKNVEDFVAQNKIGDKVKFTSLEVWYDKNNQMLLAEAAQKCGITAGSVGVPFLFDGNNKCYIGDEDIINLFKNEASIK